MNKRQNFTSYTVPNPIDRVVEKSEVRDTGVTGRRPNTTRPVRKGSREGFGSKVAREGRLRPEGRGEGRTRDDWRRASVPRRPRLRLSRHQTNKRKESRFHLRLTPITSVVPTVLVSVKTPSPRGLGRSGRRSGRPSGGSVLGQSEVDLWSVFRENIYNWFFQGDTTDTTFSFICYTPPPSRVQNRDLGSVSSLPYEEVESPPLTSRGDQVRPLSKNPGPQWVLGRDRSPTTHYKW